jgi:hypothetical protein
VNWKIVFIGGVVFYIATFVVGMVTGPLIHQGVLLDEYMATASFWRPELNQNPPDMAALMPMWITTGLIGAFIGAGIYAVIRSSLSGAAWMRGLKFGVILSLLALAFMGSYRGVFNLPDTIWVWWAVGTIVTYLVGGIALGFVAEKLAPVGGVAAPSAARA